MIEADDDDDSAVTVAKLDPPEIKPAAKAPVTLPPPAVNLPTLSRSSSRNRAPAGSDFSGCPRGLSDRERRSLADPRPGIEDRQNRNRSRPRRTRYRHHRSQWPGGKRSGARRRPAAGQAAADLASALTWSYTRKDDTFIPLETRTSIANQEQADLFVSIHANSSRDPDARGVETYYLNFTSSAEALDVAARENAASDKSVYELQDLVKKIALKEKIEESREFASNVQRALHSGLAAKSPGIRDRGVKKAPFIVLIGANMPSILAEISFVSNPGDERRLQTPEYRQRIAESLYRGISKYVGGLSGVKVASKIDKGGSH